MIDVEEPRYDVVIVGGGPAGLTAGLFCGRAELRTLLLDSGAIGGQLLSTEVIDNFPGIRNVPGFDLARRMVEHARAFGVEIRQATVLEVYSRGLEKAVRTEGGRSYEAGAVIVCAGGGPKKLGVPGESEFAGRGVSYCAVCDGPFFRDKVVAVIGSGDSAVGEGDYLTRFARKVYLISRRDHLLAAPMLRDRLLANPKVEVVWNPVVEEIGGKQSLEWIRTRNLHDGLQRRLSVSGVFVYVGFRPNSQLLHNGVVLDPAGYIITNLEMETTVPGIFAAGDIRSQSTRQIANAVGDATTAAIKAYEYLRRNGLLLQPEPLPFRRATRSGQANKQRRKAG